MALHRIRRGLNLPITGAPEQTIEDAPSPSRVALMAADYPGMKPTMHVSLGDAVTRGQLLFEDKKTPGVLYTSPATGKVVGVHRGARRALISVVVEMASIEHGGRAQNHRFKSYTSKPAESLNRDQVRDLLVESGMWPSLRKRPFGRVPAPDAEPHSIFVTATDSQPLAADPAVVMAGREREFEAGLVALGKLTAGNVYVCVAKGQSVAVPSDDRFRVEEFAGPHPAGTAGLHIHLLDPVHRGKTVWYTNYQEVIAIGALVSSGQLDFTRVVSLAGPGIRKPRLLRTRLGTSTTSLTEGELVGGEQRLISGSVLAGRKAEGEEYGYLGRFHHQLAVVREGREREFLGWLGPGFKKFSITRVFASALMPRKKFAFSTNANGSHRAIVPIGMYERVFPIDIPPSFLLRALVMQDVEQLEKLGVLELTEEDLALCSFVCPGKYEYGAHLRQALTTIEKEG
ncbi:MAG: Na(+)-translocating NADH-quinone reductase subunit A [Acidobacteriota bacterium]